VLGAVAEGGTTAEGGAAEGADAAEAVERETWGCRDHGPPSSSAAPREIAAAAPAATIHRVAGLRRGTPCRTSILSLDTGLDVSIPVRPDV
jgi:hypothetical protein